MLNKLDFLLAKVNAYFQLVRGFFLIRMSALFDKAWYLAKNPDLVQGKVNPWLHYLRYGGFEGRDPGPDFSSKWYLDTYGDVKKAGINPLVHYLRYGRKEERVARSPKNKFNSSLYSALLREILVEVPHFSRSENTVSFYSALLREILENIPNFFGSENWDEIRFGVYKPQFAAEHSLSPAKFALPIEYEDIMNHLEGFAALYDLLADEDSKTTVVKLVAYRILGYQKVKLPFALTHNKWEDEKLDRSLIKSDETFKIHFGDWSLHHYDLHSIGYPIQCFLYGAFSFMTNQYQYTKSKPFVLAQSGDVVMDCGACWGDTALYFANLVGESGKVYSFEFVPENLEIMQRNLALNPHLAPRIEIVPIAVSDTSGDKLSYSVNGPGTKLTNRLQDMFFVETVTIDDFVEKKSINHINFIKMDIEGAELSALRGAEKTLRKFRPKLAICLYHSLDDFTFIPEFLNKLDLSYIFYVDHFTIHQEETVLFAYPVADRV